jgi:hypothetical protein
LIPVSRVERLFGSRYARVEEPVVDEVSESFTETPTYAEAVVDEPAPPSSAPTPAPATWCRIDRRWGIEDGQQVVLTEWRCSACNRFQAISVVLAPPPACACARACTQ